MELEKESTSSNSSNTSARSDSSVAGTDLVIAAVRAETAEGIEDPSESETSGKFGSSNGGIGSAEESGGKGESRVAAAANAGDSPGSDPIGWAVDKLLSRIVEENSTEQLIALLSEMTKKALILQHQLELSSTRNDELLKEIEQLKGNLDEERGKFSAAEPPSPPPPVASIVYDGELPSDERDGSSPSVGAVPQLNEIYEKHHIDREVRDMLRNSRKIRRPEQRQMVIDLFLEKVGHEQGKDVLAALKGLTDSTNSESKSAVTGDARTYNRRTHNRRDNSDHPLHARSGPENRSWLFAQCVKEVEFKIGPGAAASASRHKNDYYDYGNKGRWSGGNSGGARDRGGGGWNRRRDMNGW